MRPGLRKMRQYVATVNRDSDQDEPTDHQEAKIRHPSTSDEELEPKSMTHRKRSGRRVSKIAHYSFKTLKYLNTWVSKLFINCQ